jgi:hypothetical protein
MAKSIQRSATFTADLDVRAARALFTPEGEREWAGNEWDPRYPDPRRTDGPGTVFVTEREGRRTVWVIADATPTSVRYVRATAGLDAGIVTVSCEEARPGRTTVTVAYDVTALGPEGETSLDSFAAGYEDFIASWGAAIERALETG